MPIEHRTRCVAHGKIRNRLSQIGAEITADTLGRVWTNKGR
jgi:hypothetical protein